MTPPTDTEPARSESIEYALSENIGFLLRRCFQISTSEFVRASPPELSPPRFAALARLVETDTVSQNRLGRMISTDVATIKGIVDRLRALGAVTVAPDPDDKRQRLVSITERGRDLYTQGVAASLSSAATLLTHFTDAETHTLVALLGKAAGAPTPTET